MKFVIRDDDLNFFSKPEDIERWYADLFERKIPMGFATIPFVKPISDVYTNEAPSEDKEYPISGNTELTTYIKNNPCIEILQHGTTHETKDGVFEYAGNVPLDEAKRGRNELERAFGRPVTVFAPPHDWINTQGIRAIEEAKLNVIRGRGAGLRNWIWRRQYVSIFLTMLLYRFPKYISTTPPVYPYLLNFGLHKELCSYRLEDPDIFEGLDYAYRKNGIFVVVTHLHGMNNEKKERLLNLIKKAQVYSAEFVRPSELFQ
jgi:hypothetical protein